MAMNNVEKMIIKFNDKFLVGRADKVLFEHERLEKGIKSNAIVIVDTSTSEIYNINDINEKIYAIGWDFSNEKNCY